MNRKLTGLAAAVVLALVGTLLLVGYVSSAEARAVSGEELVSVLVVTDKIEAGTPAAEIAKSVKTEHVPAKVRAVGAVGSLKALSGKYAAVELLPGEQLVADRFVASVARAGVPTGLLEVTLSLDPERALGGQIASGDTVAVIASFEDLSNNVAATHLLRHKVLVTNVQLDPSTETSEDGKSKVAPTGKLLVTLALDAPSVEKVVFAAERGTVWLSAEPKDAVEEGTQIVTKASVFA
jgi:pilus assembly protein CpaB